MQQIKDKTGEIGIANNGMKMTIIAYRSCHDIDIQFEDGSIVKHREHSDFKRGKISNKERKSCVLDPRIGETNTANNGMKMTIIAYRRATDIDIQFEDGTIARHRSYFNFKKGSILNSNCRAESLYRVGETNTANNGLKMTIIAYRRSDDIDVQFEDGTIVEHRDYTCFKNGQISYASKGLLSNRIGETNIANNGMKMTIIAYRKSYDIDVQFEDGTIVEHRDYKRFKEGQITNITHQKFKEQKMGQINIANNGMKMTIIAYRSSKDIDVRFEDGTIVKHAKLVNFRKGNISKTPKGIRTDRVGETNIANNGLKMTIIAYRSCRDIDVRFEDGTIVEHRSYHSFSKGCMAHPYITSPNSLCPAPITIQDRIGETNTANNGLKMTIIAYRSATDIDIQFEDGSIVEHKQYTNFKNGQIYVKMNRVGETNTANNGMKMTIIAYRKSDDIDVQFEDGTIVEHKRYGDFKRGAVSNVPVKNLYHRVGEINTASNGMKMTIIAYRSCRDIDIQFEDGTIVEHRDYSSFKNGQISNIDYNEISSYRIGETNTANNGLKMTIIAYRKSNDIDIQFEDGVVMKHRAYRTFKIGHISHQFPYQMNNILIEKPAYIHDNIGNFFCHCTLCGERDIMTISEAKNHQCSKRSMTE